MGEQVHSPSKEAVAHWLIEKALAEGFEKAAAEKESKKKSKPTWASTSNTDSDVRKSSTEYTTSKKRKAPTVNKDASTRSVRRTCNNRAAMATSTRTVIEQRTPLHVENETPESGGAAKMSLDVTGFAPNQIKLSLENSVVSIKGERTNKLGDKFVLDRKFRLDKKTTQAEKVTASFDDGILEVTIPTKKPEGAHRTIPIAVSTTAPSVEAPAADKAKEVASEKDKKAATEKTTPDATQEADESKKSEEEDKTDESKEKK